MIEGLKALGKTVFLTTHYMDEAQHLADRVAILRAGRIVALGPPTSSSTAAERNRRHLPAARAGRPRALGAWLGAPPEIVGDDVKVRTAGAQATLGRLLVGRRPRTGSITSGTPSRPRGDLPRLRSRAPNGSRTVTAVGDVAGLARQTRYAIVSSMRNSRAVVFGIVFPVVFLVMFNSIFSSGDNLTVSFHDHQVRTRAIFTAGLAAYAIMLQSFTNLAITMTTQQIRSAQAAARHADAALDVRGRRT
jgi:hypothetical protein